MGERSSSSSSSSSMPASHEDPTRLSPPGECSEEERRCLAMVTALRGQKVRRDFQVNPMI